MPLPELPGAMELDQLISLVIEHQSSLLHPTTCKGAQAGRHAMNDVVAHPANCNLLTLCSETTWQKPIDGDGESNMFMLCRNSRTWRHEWR